MSNVQVLSKAQMRRIEPFFPLSHRILMVDDRHIGLGIIYVIKHGLMWRDAPRAYGPHKTIYNRFIRWGRLGVFIARAVLVGSLGPDIVGRGAGYATAGELYRDLRARLGDADCLILGAAGMGLGDCLVPVQ